MIDLGSGVEAVVMYDLVGRAIGITLLHEGCDHGWYTKIDVPWVTRERPQDVVKVECWEPLTLHEVITCACGFSGSIRDGRWTTEIERKQAQSYPVPVLLTIEGHTVELGLIHVTFDRNTVQERKDLAALLRAYAEKLHDADDGDN